MYGLEAMAGHNQNQIPYGMPYAPPQNPPPPFAQQPQGSAPYTAIWNQFHSQAPPPPYPPMMNQNGHAIPPISPLAYPNAFHPMQDGHQQTFAMPSVNQQAHPQFASASISALTSRAFSALEADKEDGELTEGDRMTKPESVQLAKLQASTPGGQLRATQKHPVQSVQTTSKGAQPAVEQNTSASKQFQPTAGGLIHDYRVRIGPAENLPLRDKREQAKDFLSLLKANDLGYEQLTKEKGLAPELLEDLYKEIGVPVRTLQPAALSKVPTKVPISQPSIKPVVSSALPAVPPKVALTQGTTKLPTSLPAKPVLSTAPPGNRTVTTPSVPSPVDRKEYLARLQAARSAKTQTSAKETLPGSPVAPVTGATTKLEPKKLAALGEPKQTLSKVSVPVLTTATKTQKPNGSESALTVEKKNASTELARQKLAALANARKASPAVKPTGPSSAAASSDAPASRASSTSSAIYASGQEQAQSEGSTSHLITQFNIAGSSVAATVSKPSNVFQQHGHQLTSPPSWASLSGGIPGLFMTGSSPPVGASQPGRHPPPPLTPFGQPRHHAKEKFVIDLSDDETESNMEIDDGAEFDPDATSAKSAGLVQIKEAIRNLPSLVNFPPSAASTKQGTSGIGTPPAVQTPGSQASLDDLKRKEDEIAAMRKRIAEIEKRKAANKSKQPENSRPATPAANLSAQPKLPTPPFTQGVAVKTPKVEVPLQAVAQSVSTSSIGTTSRPTPTKLPHVTASTPWEQSVATKSPAPGSEEWKRSRRAEIQSDLPSLDAQLASDKARVEQMKQEIQLLEAKYQQRALDKANLIKELEEIGIDTEGMPHEELQAKKDEIVQQREMEVDLLGEGTSRSSGPSSLHHGPLPPLRMHANPHLVATHNDAASPAQHSTSHAAHAPVADSAVNGSDSSENAKPMDVENTSPNQVPNLIPTQGLVIDDALEPSETFESQSQTIPDLSIPRSHMPEPSDQGPLVEEPTEHSIEPQNSTNLNASDQGLESDDSLDDMEMEISDDESDAESPHGLILSQSTEPVTPAAFSSSFGGTLTTEDLEDSVAVDPVTAVGTSSSFDGGAPTPEDVENFYSPDPVTEDLSKGNLDVPVEGRVDKDGDAIMEDQGLSAQEEGVPAKIQGEAISQSLGTPLEEGEIETSESPDGGEDYEPEESISHPVIQHEKRTISTADNLAVGLQYAAEPATGTPGSALAQFAITEVSTANPKRVHPNHTGIVGTPFSPYNSPLRGFKAYRNHPDYKRNVQGGYRSMTYSHQIDQAKELCPYEAAGGICNDNSCIFQHFRDMELSADMILVQLGTANPGRNAEQQQQWKNGLQSVIKELRSASTDDPEIIADEFSKYRREFLRDVVKDVSKVLNIPGY